MKRLEKLCELIYPYTKIADVGCDHGYLIKLAYEKYNIELAYAIDNKEGPISQAKNNLANLENVKYFVSDGLDNVDENIDCVIIAGMGGCLINQIINNNINKLSYIKRFVLEANRDNKKVREFMINNGFDIVDEDIIYEDNHYYEIDVFEKTKEIKKYSEIELYFGPILYKKRNSLFIDKCKDSLSKLSKISSYKNDETTNLILKELENICK